MAASQPPRRSIWTWGLQSDEPTDAQRAEYAKRLSEELGVSPGEVLFVGDTFDADVTGPQSVGMPCAWLNRKGAPVPEGCKPPDLEIEDLKDTLSILGL